MIFSKYTKRLFVALVDFLILSLSLYLAMSLRRLFFVSFDLFLSVFYPFLIIIFSSLLIFYIYGLYEKMTVRIYRELNQRIVSSQILSALVGSAVFYLLPYFSIAPKTVLVIYVIISSILIFLWRKKMLHLIGPKSSIKMLLVAEGDELKELTEELKNNKLVKAQKVDSLDLVESRDLDLYTKIKNKIKEEKFNMLAINMHHPHIKNNISLFYELLLEKVEIVNFADLYEETFNRIPLTNIDAGWFFNNLYGKESKFYEKVKRTIDLILAIPLFLFSLIFYPFIYLFIKIEDGGDIFYTAERVGKDNRVFKLYKFRSMTNKKKEEVDATSKDESKRITKFGNFIRKTRIDELPQLLNVIRGELSFIGPRPEIPALVNEYSNQIPFYGIRHTIMPGLSGFAQIYQEQKSVPKFGLATDATKVKLSYDIYYLKHRSAFLDISLMLKTVKVLLGKSGL